MTTLNITFFSIEKYLVLTLLILTITSITSNSSPIIYRRQNPVSEADIREFKLWVKFASVSYCDVTDWKCGEPCEDTAGTRLIKNFPHSISRDNTGYVAINDKEKAIIVAYRGTSDLQSLLQDLKLDQVPYNPIPKSKVHFGFYDTYNDTKKEMISLIKKLVKENPSYKVISTGHSLGGSIAVLQTLDLIDIPGLNPSNLFTYTYGQPRIGNDVFGEFITNSDYKFFRIVNKDDPIPSLPFRDFNYIQYGPEYWINPKNEVVVCSGAEDDKCSNSIPDKSINSHIYYFQDLLQTIQKCNKPA